MGDRPADAQEALDQLIMCAPAPWRGRVDALEAADGEQRLPRDREVHVRLRLGALRIDDGAGHAAHTGGGSQALHEGSYPVGIDDDVAVREDEDVTAGHARGAGARLPGVGQRFVDVAQLGMPELAAAIFGVV